MKPTFLRSLAIIILINILVMFWMLLISLPLWSIKTVTVSGNSYIPQGMILEKAAIPAGQSIWKISAKKLRKDLMVLPWIKSVQLKRHWPSTLELLIIPRDPFFQVNAAGRIWIIDREGNILNRDGLNIQGFVLIEIVGLASIAQIDENIPDLVSYSQELLSLYKLNQIKFDLTRKNDIQLWIKPKLLIKLGDRANPVEKINTLKQLLTVLDQKLPAIEYIDLRSYRSPAVKMRP